MNLSTTLAGIPLNSCILNASGPRDTTLEELQALQTSESAAIMMKSCTIDSRPGNPEPRYVEFTGGAQQSMGLPNHGYQAYLEYAQILKETSPKPIVASVSGLSPEDNLHIIQAFQDTPVDAIELNLSCPNIPGKPQTAYDLTATDRLLEQIQSTKPLGLKLPPLLDPALVRDFCSCITQHQVSFVTLINSVGNTLVIDPATDRPIIKPKHGLGGLSGSMIKPIALGNVWMFHEALKDTQIDIIGVGGISFGRDVYDFLLAGATAVQIGTAYQSENIPVFSRLNQELLQVFAEKKIASVDTIRGTLQEYQ